MAVNDIFRLALIGRMDTGQDLVNTLYFKQISADGPSGISAPQQLMALFDANAKIAFAGCFCGNANFLKMEVRGVTDPLVGEERIVIPEQSGSEGAEYSAPQNATEVLFKDGLVGRRHMNRIYMWPPAESVVANGLYNETHIDAVLAFADAIATLTDDDDEADFLHVVYSAVGGNSLPVSNVLVVPRVRTQRRRTLGFGS